MGVVPIESGVEPPRKGLPEQSTPRLQLDWLVHVSRKTRLQAEAAIQTSRALMEACTSTCAASQGARLASRRHLVYARIDGKLDGRTVTAVVRRDGTMTVEPVLRSRADLLVGLGESFDNGRLPANLSGGPLAASLTLMRACDIISGLELGIIGKTCFDPLEHDVPGTG